MATKKQIDQLADCEKGNREMYKTIDKLNEEIIGLKDKLRFEANQAIKYRLLYNDEHAKLEGVLLAVQVLAGCTNKRFKAG